MSILNVLIFPDLRLKQMAQPVDIINDEIKQIVKDLFDTLYKENGIGLAATQVNINKRICVIDIGDESAPLCLINPKIIKEEGLITSEEGCLSFPGIAAKIKRAKTISVEYKDLNGKQQLINASGLLSSCLQHEIDHINGITLFDRVSTLKKTLIKNKLRKIKGK